MSCHPIKPCPNCNQDRLYVTHKKDSLGRNIFRLNCPNCEYQSQNLPNCHPADFEFPFGKHRKKKLSEIEAEDPGYLDWCQKNLSDRWLVAKIQEFTGRKVENNNLAPPSPMTIEGEF